MSGIDSDWLVQLQRAQSKVQEHAAELHRLTAIGRYQRLRSQRIAERDGLKNAEATRQHLLTDRVHDIIALAAASLSYAPEAAPTFAREQVLVAAAGLENFSSRTFNNFPVCLAMLKAYAATLPPSSKEE